MSETGKMNESEKILRIKLTQNEAHYRKEESLDNKMTYPLPPFSTIIGALHKACNFKEYHPMDISVQGKFNSLIKRPFLNHAFFDSRQDDRGILVKMHSDKLLSSSFTKVASALKPTGNSFKKNITIKIENKKLYEEYMSLKKLEEQKKIQKNLKQHFDLGLFKSMVTSISYYEILTDVELIIHVRSEQDTIEKIKENINNLKSIGRGEDFVDLIECKEVTLSELKEGIKSKYSAYHDIELIKNDIIAIETDMKLKVGGTKYSINKNYEIEDSKRKFEKIKVLYTSEYETYNEDKSNKVFLDDEEYIVSFN